MEIVLADNAGFCFGVKRALEMSFKAAAEKEEGIPIYTLGPLIHNPQVVAELEKKGLKVAGSPGDIDAGVAIVRCHGVPPKVVEELTARGIDVVDSTCPYVRRAMRWVRQLKDEGYQVVIVGDKSHPEVKAIFGASDETAWVIESPRAVDELPNAKRIGIVAQTTQSAENFSQCVKTLMGRAEELKAFNTICTATEQRQSAAEALAAQVDVMVVIGGRNSANTKRLAEVCQKSCAQTHHVETEQELRPEWFAGKKKAGVTAGASTPKWLIEGVIKRMSEFTEEKLTQEEEGQREAVESTQEVEGQEEVTESTEDEVNEPVGMQEYDDMLPELKPNSVIKGKVVQVNEDEVLVDIGYKSEGRIPANELGLKSDQKPSDAVNVGDEIDVWVLKIEDSEGNVLLSKRRADTRQAWEKLEKAYEEGDIIRATVTQTVKGGLLVDVGVRGFIPASHVSRNFVDNLEQYVGQELPLKIIEFDRQKNNVVFSHKAVLEEEYQKAKEDIFANLEENTIVRGVVRRLTDFGAFVDIGGGVEGLLHVSEMAYSRIDHPSDVLSVGDEIDVMVLGVDKENERISLGLKQTMADPWETIEERYHVGDVVKGTVTRVVDFGAFVKLEDGVEGLVHISQLSHRHVAKAEEVVSPGEEVEVKVISVDPNARRIGLSIRELEPKPETPAPQKNRPREEKIEQDNEELTTNLGDVFGDLFRKK